jgi:hypothetical protein
MWECWLHMTRKQTDSMRGSEESLSLWCWTESLRRHIKILEEWPMW